MIYYQPLVQYLSFKTPNQWLCSLSTKRQRESEKVKCHINKKVFPEPLTLLSPENCALAQLVHSSHIGECARSQSWPSPAVIRQTEGWGTHNNDPWAFSAQIFSRSASDSHINHLTGMTGTGNGSMPCISLLFIFIFCFHRGEHVYKSTRLQEMVKHFESHATLLQSGHRRPAPPHPTLPRDGAHQWQHSSLFASGLVFALFCMQAEVMRTLVQVLSGLLPLVLI